MSTFDIKKFLINEGMTRVSRDRNRLLTESEEGANLSPGDEETKTNTTNLSPDDVVRIYNDLKSKYPDQKFRFVLMRAPRSSSNQKLSLTFIVKEPVDLEFDAELKQRLGKGVYVWNNMDSTDGNESRYTWYILEIPEARASGMIRVWKGPDWNAHTVEKMRRQIDDIDLRGK